MIKQQNIKESAKELATKVAPIFKQLDIVWLSDDDRSADYVPNAIEIYEELLRLYNELNNSRGCTSIQCGNLKVERTDKEFDGGSITFSFVISTLVI